EQQRYSFLATPQNFLKKGYDLISQFVCCSINCSKGVITLADKTNDSNCSASATLPTPVVSTRTNPFTNSASACVFTCWPNAPVNVIKFNCNKHPRSFRYSNAGSFSFANFRG